MNIAKRKIFDEWYFFKNNKGVIEYYSKCKNCIYSCKQAHRIKELYCTKFRSYYTDNK